MSAHGMIVQGMSAPGAAVDVAVPAGPPATAWVATTATPGPDTPDVEEGVDPDSVTPGVLGFAVTLAAVLACIPLFLSMTRKIRGVQHRGRLEEAERAASGAPDAAGTGAGEGTRPGGTPPTGGTPPAEGTPRGDAERPGGGAA